MCGENVDTSGIPDHAPAISPGEDGHPIWALAITSAGSLGFENGGTPALANACLMMSLNLACLGIRSVLSQQDRLWCP